MTGAVMHFSPTVREFLVILLSVSVTEAQNEWGITYPSTKICGIKGSTVNISCTYTYPSTLNDRTTTIDKTLWFTKGENYDPADLLTDSDYTGRVRYHCENNKCTLTITDLRLSDSAVYKFRFISNQAIGRHTGLPGVTLSVTDLQMQVIRSELRQDSTWAEVKCQSSCLPDNPTFIWYKNGQIWKETTSPSHEDNFNCTDSYSCVVKGHEKFPSPPVYPPKFPSVSVSPSAEIVEGSSVTLTCSSDANPAANYTWYKENEDSPKASGQIFPITDFRPEHSGDYYCEAQNTRGRHKSTLHLRLVTGTWKLPVALSITAVVLAFTLLLFLLWIRREKSARSDAEERPHPREQQVDEIQYASVQFLRPQPDALYCNFSPAQAQRSEDLQGESLYNNMEGLQTTPQRGQAAVEDSSVLYSTVRKVR